MKSIRNIWVHPVNKIEVEFEFFPTNSFKELKDKKVTQSYGLCFWQNKMVLAKIGSNGDWWTLPGGQIEEGESFDEAMIREAKEEANVRILKMIPIGYQSVKEKDQDIHYQVRYFCRVEPIDDFVSDPDQDITEIKWIDPKDYKQYFDWGGIGEYLVKEAIRLNESFT